MLFGAGMLATIARNYEDGDQMLVGAIGCGNVGFNTLRAFNAKGHQVIGFDPSRDAHKRLAATFGSSSAAESLAQLRIAEAVFICVPTDPHPENGGADLRIFEEVINELSKVTRELDSCIRVVVQRSTCPPGTASKMSKQLATEYSVNPRLSLKSYAVGGFHNSA